GFAAPPRLDLGSEELLRAHVHAVWLSGTGQSLGRSVMNIVDTGSPADNYPLRDDFAAALQLSETRLRECIEECRRVLASCNPDLAGTGWYSDDWLMKTVRASFAEFDQACDRWRELFSIAERQKQEARTLVDRSHQ